MRFKQLDTGNYSPIWKEKCDLEFAVEEIKKNSRRFAKRQLTWFKKNPETLWFDFSEDLKVIIDKIEDRLKSSIYE